MSFENSAIFPITADIGNNDHLTLGGCDANDLTSTFGTPLYVFDEETLRSMCRKTIGEFSTRHSNTRVLYASKAFINPVLANLVMEEGLGIDVVSGGELAVAQVVNFPPELIYFHGNNKSSDELRMALDYGVGRIVIDSFHELGVLNELARSHKIVQNIMIRLSPGVDPHTHTKTTTGILDSKFGFSIATGDAAKAIRYSLGASNLNLVGVHFHLGSPIFELEPYSIAIDAVLTFIAPFISEGLDLMELSPGGGFAVGYLRDQLPPPISSYADTITSAMTNSCYKLGLKTPMLTIEPGRSIIGRSGVALYSVGSIKEIPSVRKYVSLDGGMGDNIRPTLYDARYEAVVANRMSDIPTETVTLAGKFCESGDILIRDIKLPELVSGDIIAVPTSGAYAPSMASTYNLNPRPAVVMVNNGKARLIRRRETYEDLMTLDVLE